MKTCPVCGGDLNPYLRLYDDRFGYPGEFTLKRCGKCRHGALDARFSNDELERLYTEFYPRTRFSLEDYLPHGELGGFRGWLEGVKSSAFRWVPRKVRVLDIGCGFGETLGYHKNRGCEVYGVEADANILRVAEEYGYKVRVGLFSPADYDPVFFDYVTMDQVVEHLTDPLSTLREVARVMKPGGRLIISTPNSCGWGSRVFGPGWLSWHAPYHLQFFTRRSMALAAGAAGFTVVESKTITDSAYLCLQWNHLRFRPRQGCKSKFWVQDQKFTKYEKMFAVAMTALTLFKVNHLLTRFFDAMGIGDNLVFVLRKRD